MEEREIMNDDYHEKECNREKSCIIEVESISLIHEHDFSHEDSTISQEESTVSSYDREEEYDCETLSSSDLSSEFYEQLRKGCDEKRRERTSRFTPNRYTFLSYEEYCEIIE